MTNKIFNTNKTAEQYAEAQPLFFGPEPGLFDTVNKQYPEIWALYKEMKALDWDEVEFDYGQCNIEFKTCVPDTAAMMKETLAYQWGGDSVAARSVAPVLAPFITNSELWAAYQRVSDNEVVHAATYSEIIRMSFDDPSAVMADILGQAEAIQRMETVNKVFMDAFIASHTWALNQCEYSQELYNKVYMMMAALLMMERIQFMASFAITFTICSTGQFQPIGMAVKKIAQDELEVHVQLAKKVLEIEHRTERGMAANVACKDTLDKMFEEVIASEFRQLDWLFRDGRQLLGTNIKALKQWVLFNAKDPLVALGLNSDHKFPAENPQKHLEQWINMNKSQSAPQEQDNAAYKVGVVFNDDHGQVFETLF